MSKKVVLSIAVIFMFGFFYLNSQKDTEQQTPKTTRELVDEKTNDEKNSELFNAPCGYTTPIGQGPYYVADAPLLMDGNLNYTNRPGNILVLSGYVLHGIETPTPIANAEIDVWQTDSESNYHPLGSGSVDDYSPDEVELRGVVITDDDGHYELTTILPEEYSGRPRHLHVKVRAPGKPELTTQLFWQQEGDNNTVTNSDLNPGSRDCQILTATPDDGNLVSTYNFILR